MESPATHDVGKRLPMIARSKWHIEVPGENSLNLHGTSKHLGDLSIRFSAALPPRFPLKMTVDQCFFSAGRSGGG